jgi:hypothetical protein
MKADDAVEVLASFTRQLCLTPEQIEEIRKALLAVRRELHELRNKAAMTCEHEPCGDCCGCCLADDLNGNPLADWTEPAPVTECPGSRAHTPYTDNVECHECGQRVFTVAYNHPRYGTSYMIVPHPGPEGG